MKESYFSTKLQDFLYWVGSPSENGETPAEVRRRGAIKTAIGTVSILGVILAGSYMIDQNDGIECKPGTYTETAESGDTSWDIASGKADEFNVSTGEYLYQLQEDNPSLKDGVQVGEEYILRESCSR